MVRLIYTGNKELLLVIYTMVWFLCLLENWCNHTLKIVCVCLNERYWMKEVSQVAL